MDAIVAALAPAAVPAASCRGSASRFGLRVAIPPKLSESRLSSRVQSSLTPAAVAAALGHVPHGQWAPLDADTLELIDRSTCLVEPDLVGRALLLLPVLVQVCTQHVQRRARSVAAREYPHREAFLERTCALPSCSLRAVPVASLRLFREVMACSWMIGSFLCSVMWSTLCSS